MRKLRIWYGLTVFGRGVIIALSGILIKSAGNLVEADFPALLLTSAGIIIFIVGLCLALFGLDNRHNEFN